MMAGTMTLTDDGGSAGDDDAQELEFRIIDYGHARLSKRKALAKLPKAPGLELSYRKYALPCPALPCPALHYPKTHQEVGEEVTAH